VAPATPAPVDSTAGEVASASGIKSGEPEDSSEVTVPEPAVVQEPVIESAPESAVTEAPAAQDQVQQ